MGNNMATSRRATNNTKQTTTPSEPCTTTPPLMTTKSPSSKTTSLSKPNLSVAAGISASSSAPEPLVCSQATTSKKFKIFIYYTLPHFTTLISAISKLIKNEFS